MSQQPWGDQQRPGNPQQNQNFGAPQGGYGNPPQPGYGRPQGPAGYGPGSYGPGGPGGPGGYGPGGTGPRVPEKRSKTPLIVGGVVGAAVLVGGGIFAYSVLGGTDSSTASGGVPSDALGVIEMSLNPSAADQLALKNIIEKFPQIDAPATTDYKEALWNLLPDEADMPDYEAQIKPWLGDSVSMALMGVDDAGEPQPLLAIDVTDEDKARDFFEAQLEGDDEVQFFFHEGVLVMHDGTVTPEQLEDGSLRDNEEYREDMDEIGDGNLVSAWFSSAAIDVLLDNADLAGLQEGPTEPIEALRGTHGAIGIKVEENLLSLHSSVLNTRDFDGEDVTDFVGSLPADAPFAVGFGLNDEAYTQMWEVLQQTPDADLQLAQFGITSQADLKALLGQKMGAALAGLDQPTPSIAVKVQTADTARHEEIVAPILAELQYSMPLETRTDGDEVSYASGFTLEDVVDGELGDNETYERVVDTDGDALAILYFDMNNLFGTIEGAVDRETRDVVRPIAGAGAVSSVDGDRSVVDIRVAFN